MRRPHPRLELVPTARPLQLGRPLLAALVLACGGDDGTGPDPTPDLTGRYRAVRALAAVTCTPQRPPVGGGTVVLDAFVDTLQVRVQQAGSRLTLTYPDFPGSPADTGSVTQDGTVTMGYRELVQEAPRAGNRAFFVDLTATETLRRADGGARLIGSGTYVNVFREGAATAPIFATCSRASTIEFTRTGS